MRLDQIKKNPKPLSVFPKRESIEKNEISSKTIASAYETIKKNPKPLSVFPKRGYDFFRF